MTEPAGLIVLLAQKLYEEATKASRAKAIIWLQLPPQQRQLWRDMAAVAIEEVRRFDDGDALPAEAKTRRRLTELVREAKEKTIRPKGRVDNFAGREKANEQAEARARNRQQ